MLQMILRQGHLNGYFSVVCDKLNQNKYNLLLW